MELKDTNPADIAAYLNEAFRTGDSDRMCLSIGEAIKVFDIADVAVKSRLQRTSIYRAFAGGGAYPNLTTVVRVLGAMGLRLHVVTVKRGERAKPSRRLKSPVNSE